MPSNIFNSQYISTNKHILWKEQLFSMRALDNSSLDSLTITNLGFSIFLQLNLSMFNQLKYCLWTIPRLSLLLSPSCKFTVSSCFWNARFHKISVLPLPHPHERFFFSFAPNYSRISNLAPYVSLKTFGFATLLPVGIHWPSMGGGMNVFWTVQ